ncbi:MAG TPA: hypothetical protein VMP12_00615 [Candidatus Sulfotelmatobacter sp.]|nr:hypothetical protein [Candidatus Sulfotelmatobacter sp.]
MSKRPTLWLTAQQTAVVMNTTSAEICRLLSLGRLSGSKQKQPGRPGNGQWLIDPKSVAKEKRRIATRTIKTRAAAKSRKRKSHSK